MDDLIPGGAAERCLDTLFDRLAGTGAAGRRALAEAEDHLRAAIAVERTAGLPPEQAERSAVTRFGDPAAIAGALRRTHQGLIRPLISGAVIVGIVGALALGISGAISEIAGRLISPGFVAGDAPGVTYTPARCAEYLQYYPHAAAADLDHWGEVVQFRVAVGVLGLVALIVAAATRSRLRGEWARWRPPVGVVTLVLAALFGMIAVGLLGPALMETAYGYTNGHGASLADGTVALLLTATTAMIGLRARRRAIS